MKSGAGLSNLLKGKADIKRDAARTIMRDMADNAFNALPTRSDNLRRQLTNLGTAITGYFFEGGAGDLRASDTRSVLEGLSRLNTRLTDIQPLPQGQLARVTVDNPAVNLTSLGDGFTQSAIFADARDELATGQLSNTRKTALANDLGDAIAAAFRQQNQGAPAREAFALSSGETLRGELAAALGEGGGAMPDLDQVLEGAFLRAASRVADNQAHETTVRITPTVGNPYDAPEMTVGGILYTPVKDLGEGGFAHVVLYREKDPPQDGAPAELAIKLPKEEGDTPEEVLKNLKLDVQEFQLHRTAVGDGNDNVMNGGDFVRLPGGRLALTMEVLPNGDVHAFKRKLHAAVEPGVTDPQSGRITQDEARLVALTLIQDMAKGLQHMHDVTGVTHYDFKGANCMIGADGLAKIVDFGESTTGDEIVVYGKKPIDNPTWKAPELLLREAEIGTIEEYSAYIENHRKAELTAQMPEIMSLLGMNPNDDDGRIFIGELCGNIATDLVPPELVEQVASRVTVDYRVDIWSLGTTAYELLMNDTVLPASAWNADREARLRDFERGGGPAIDTRAVGPDTQVGQNSLARSTGDRAIDTLLNGMLKGKPGERLDAGDIVRDPVFETDGVGSDEVRELIKAIASGSAQEIDEARRALASALG